MTRLTSKLLLWKNRQGVRSCAQRGGTLLAKCETYKPSTVPTNTLQGGSPDESGGEMIATVSFKETTYATLPHKFEAGTPNIAGGIALKTAIDWLNDIGLDNVMAYENELLEYATQELAKIEGIRFIGEASKKAAVISFLVGDIHPYDMGMILDKLGIAVRTGHHCAQPVMDEFCIPGTIRASFAVYNTKEEVDRLVEGVKKAQQMLS